MADKDGKSQATKKVLRKPPSTATSPGVQTAVPNPVLPRSATSPGVHTSAPRSVSRPPALADAPSIPDRSSKSSESSESTKSQKSNRAPPPQPSSKPRDEKKPKNAKKEAFKQSLRIKGIHIVSDEDDRTIFEEAPCPAVAHFRERKLKFKDGVDKDDFASRTVKKKGNRFQTKADVKRKLLKKIKKEQEIEKARDEGVPPPETTSCETTASSTAGTPQRDEDDEIDRWTQIAQFAESTAMKYLKQLDAQYNLKIFTSVHFVYSVYHAFFTFIITSAGRIATGKRPYFSDPTFISAAELEMIKKLRDKEKEREEKLTKQILENKSLRSSPNSTLTVSDKSTKSVREKSANAKSPIPNITDEDIRKAGATATAQKETVEAEITSVRLEPSKNVSVRCPPSKMQQAKPNA